MSYRFDRLPTGVNGSPAYSSRRMVDSLTPSAAHICCLFISLVVLAGFLLGAESIVDTSSAIRRISASLMFIGHLLFLTARSVRPP